MSLMNEFMMDMALEEIPVRSIVAVETGVNAAAG
jgi:predicted TIM-barrel enzyme